MIVKFQNTFHAPGFGRNRFPAGIIRDVPDVLKNSLPKSAEILPNDTPNDMMNARERDDLAAHDFARVSSDTSEEALVTAGMAGYAEEGGEALVAPEAWMFNDKEYKTEAAMKAAITRASK